jgi:tetratricopeptide (TPR) repeat protein
MSPEQARGQDLDGRSDVFSLGLVLYEMVTGRQAFAGETTAVVFDGILNRTPRAPSELNSDVPPDLERIIAKAIEKDRDARYQSAADLTADLRHLKRVTDSGGTLATVASMPVAGSAAWPSVAAQSAARVPAASPAPSGSTQAPSRRWRTAAAAAVAVLLVAAGVAYWQLRDTSQALAESDRILIADFGNTTGDAMFDGTLKQALAVKLEESPFLNVVADQRVRETLAFMSRPADTPVTMGVAREICQRQGIKAVMLGDIAMLGSSFVVTLTAENCQNGEVLAREQVTATSKEQVLAAVGAAAATMREKLGESLASIEKMDKAIEQSTTSSLEALKAFAIGDEKRNTGSDQDAIPFFKRALELDPNFAVAHARLGTVYSNLGENKLAIEHRTRAYELRDRVSERERFYILGHYYSGVTREIDKALETYDLWKQTYPRDPVPYINSGTLYSQRGESERTIEAYSKALEIDPARRIAYSNLFGKYIELDRLDEARALLDRQIKSLGETPETQFKSYEIATRQGDRVTAERYAALLEKGPLTASLVALRSAETAVAGRMRESRQLTERHAEMLRQQGLPQRALTATSSFVVASAIVGQNSVAREFGDRLAAMPPAERGVDANANLAFAYAKMGDTAKARRFFADADPAALPDAQLRDVLTQVFDGLLAVSTGRPAEAIKRLENLPVENRHTVVMNGLLTRANAYAATGQWAEAERDFRAVLARKPQLQFNLAAPYAHVGLARALAAQGNTAGAREEYKKFLDMWSQADADIAVLREVKVEVAKLGT